jgi:tRNA(fMet)-specific endonuclease VapC
MLMLDTNICIYVLKRRPTEVLEKFNAADELRISSIVCAELWAGVEQSLPEFQALRREQLELFLSLLTIVAWDEAAAQEYAICYTTLKQQGQLIGNMDLLIAAHARSLNATLVTNNTREFERIVGLKLENWV